MRLAAHLADRRDPVAVITEDDLQQSLTVGKQFADSWTSTICATAGPGRDWLFSAPFWK